MRGPCAGTKDTLLTRLRQRYTDQQIYDSGRAKGLSLHRRLHLDACTSTSPGTLFACLQQAHTTQTLVRSCASPATPPMTDRAPCRALLVQASSRLRRPWRWSCPAGTPRKWQNEKTPTRSAACVRPSRLIACRCGSEAGPACAAQVSARSPAELCRTYAGLHALCQSWGPSAGGCHGKGACGEPGSLHHAGDIRPDALPGAAPVRQQGGPRAAHCGAPGTPARLAACSVHQQALQSMY